MTNVGPRFVIDILDDFCYFGIYCMEMRKAVTPQTHPVKFTYEDYLLFPDDGKRHELIDGEHYMTPSPSTKHQRILGKLFRIISQFVDEKKRGEALVAPCDVIFSDLDVVQPDLLFVSTEKGHLVTEKNIQGAPDLIVEILSETTRKTDEIIKRKLYERYGVREYWIVDPELEAVKVYRMTEQGYLRAVELARERGDALTTPLLPALNIPLAAVFE